MAALALAACSARVGGGPFPVPGAPPSAPEAARFLTQTTFGATDASIAELRAAGYSDWIAQQIAMPVSGSHLAFMQERRALPGAPNPSVNEFYGSFWQQAATAPDQLRQRVKLALSEMFVISVADPNVDPLGAASYYDMLGANAFGNYRTLLEQVTLHPMMGIYLTWMANQKEDPATGRQPDQNYAREVMQLMTIGVSRLNLDGAVQTDANGKPIPTYAAEDVSGLSKVLTGYSWYSPRRPTTPSWGATRTRAPSSRPMIAYPAFHSISAKPSSVRRSRLRPRRTRRGDLKIALDTLFNHPNVGPFVSRQLIQRLVTSNPSPAYVARVARVFNNNGAGVRGDMAAVIRAILMDAEARSAAAALDPNFGKLREPVVRMGNWIRVTNATSQTGGWLIPSTSANTSLGQSALASPSVFNFWRPGYSPPNTRIGVQGLVGPEFQVVDEVSVAGYLNTLQTTVDAGIGSTAPAGGRDVRTTYAAEIALARDPGALVERMNLLLLNGQMSPALRSRIVDAVTGVAIPGGSATPTQINNALLNRSKLAVYMSMASAEYLAQR